jgi:hypothetical protein
MSANTATRTDAIAQMRTEWQQKPLLRAGIYVVLAIFWVYGILELNDAVSREREAWTAAEARATRARATAASADWLLRAQEAGAAVSEHEQLLWREGSIGLSQAQFQERVNASFSGAAIVVRNLRVATATDAPVSAELADIVPLRARAQVEFRPATFYAWLDTLQRAKREKRAAITVESLTIRAGSFGQPALAEIELAGFVQKGATKSAEADASTAPGAAR